MSSFLNSLSYVGVDRRGRKASNKPTGSISEVLRKVARESRSCWPHLAGILALTFLSTPFAMLLPLPLKLVVDSGIHHGPVPHALSANVPASWTQTTGGILMTAAGLLLAVGLLMQAQVLASWMLQTYAGEKLVHDFRARLFWHVQRLRLSFYDKSGTSDTAYRIQHDAPAIQLVTIQGFVPFVSAALGFAGMAIVTAKIDRELALIAFAISPALIWLSRASSRRVHKGWHEVKDLDSSAMSVLTEVLGAVKLVKAFGREGDEDRRFTSRSSRRMKSQMRLALIQASYYCATALLITVGTAATLYVGARHVQSGQLTLGELLVVMAYMTQLYEPLRTMSNKIPELQASLVSVERAFALLDEVPEPLESATSRPLRRARGQVEFQNVTFAYANGRKVLDKASFTIEPGTKVGILGPTGSGKTTLVNLLTRFYDPTEGRILLDGVDIREFRLADLRRQFAIVPQEPVLFSTSIAENIAFAVPEADDQTIIRAAQAANAHDFITQLPQGYETKVGDRGSRLSGGERQRVAIARAFLKDSPILILDEPTSAVDMKTEAAVMSATEDLLHERTSFMIAHRLSTLEHCDMLLRFHDGELEIVTENVRETLHRVAIAESGLKLSLPVFRLGHADELVGTPVEEAAAPASN